MRKKDLTERENFTNSDEIELPQEKEDIPLSQQEEPIYRNLFNLEDYLKAIYEQENNNEKFKDSNAYSLKNEVKCNYIVNCCDEYKENSLPSSFYEKENCENFLFKEMAFYNFSQTFERKDAHTIPFQEEKFFVSEEIKEDSISSSINLI